MVFKIINYQWCIKLSVMVYVTRSVGSRSWICLLLTIRWLSYRRAGLMTPLRVGTSFSRLQQEHAGKALPTCAAEIAIYPATDPMASPYLPSRFELWWPRPVSNRHCSGRFSCLWSCPMGSGPTLIALNLFPPMFRSIGSDVAQVLRWQYPRIASCGQFWAQLLRTCEFWNLAL